jgi:hypothetical protein
MERQSLVLPSCMRGHDPLLRVPSHTRERAARPGLQGHDVVMPDYIGRALDRQSSTNRMLTERKTN